MGTCQASRRSLAQPYEAPVNFLNHRHSQQPTLFISPAREILPAIKTCALPFLPHNPTMADRLTQLQDCLDQVTLPKPTSNCHSPFDVAAPHVKQSPTNTSSWQPKCTRPSPTPPRVPRPPQSQANRSNPPPRPPSPAARTPPPTPQPQKPKPKPKPKPKAARTQPRQPPPSTLPNPKPRPRPSRKPKPDFPLPGLRATTPRPPSRPTCTSWRAT